MRTLIIFLLILPLFSVLGQDKLSQKFANTIKKKDLKKHLEVLASDEYEGRETGTKGQKMASAYIANEFEKLNLEPPNDSYFQSFELTKSTLVQSYFRKEEGNERKECFQDFIYYSKSETNGEEYMEIVFADSSTLSNDDFKNAYVAYALNDLKTSTQKLRTQTKEKGAKGLITIIKDEKEFEGVVTRYGNYLKRPQMSTKSRENGNLDQLIIVNKALLSWIYEKDFEEIKPGDRVKIIFNADYLDSKIETENVLGFLEGKEKPEEIVVITSHYDHIGIIDGQINNGADDDGSGTVSVLEIAEAFSKAAEKGYAPSRSLLFMTVTGEEKGLLGSEYYTDNPIYPLQNTVSNLNIDMIGRIDEKHKENPEYVYIIGSDKLSQDLHNLSETINETYTQLDLDYTYNDENDPNRFYYRSDHYNFAKNNIPIIFYFNGTHADYHKPTDTIEKINFDVLEKRAQFIFHTAWEIANRKERIALDSKENPTEN